jgi:succinate-semialdehyde dehydrogenase/glutarate-semialdehyde dehydrogenase
MVNIDEKSILDSVAKTLFIGGKWRPASNGAVFKVEDPSTKLTIAEVADATAKDASDALDACASVQSSWASTPPRVRGEILRRAFELILARSDELALLMTLEMGKPVAESKGEVAYAAEFFRWFSEEAVRINGDYYTAPDGNARVMTLRQPVGPSLLITPWNFPLAMGTRKIGPALAAGCTVIVKPAEQTPLCMAALMSILEEAGLPPGVVNMITSSDPGAVTKPLISDSRLRKLSFTGSTEVGKLLMSQASGGLLRLSMELGGNAPLIVFADSDLDKAVNGAVFAKMRNMGEACTSANRIFVENSIVDEFSERLAQAMAELKVGRGTQDGVQVGPLIDQPAIDKVTSLIDDATSKGARIVTGGSKLDMSGYFYSPTVLVGVDSEWRIAQEEIFGPIAPIYSFSSEDEAISMANNTNYGLVAYLFTENLNRALRVTEKLETGMIGLNQGLVSNAAAPFGGVKQSGFGREGGFEGINEYLYIKYIAINHKS